MVKVILAQCKLMSRTVLITIDSYIYHRIRFAVINFKESTLAYLFNALRNSDFFKFMQPENANSPISVTPSSMYTSSSAVAQAKASSPIVFTLAGTVIFLTVLFPPFSGLKIPEPIAETVLPSISLGITSSSASPV